MRTFGSNFVRAFLICFVGVWALALIIVLAH
jgi:hypothetical protein